MKFVIAIDSFKGSMSSMQAGMAAGEGVKRVYPDAKIIVKGLADGGEGTTETLVEAMNGSFSYANVLDPLGRTIGARYGIIDNIAVLEMAEASGLTLLSEEERNPYQANTYGFGELILDAFHKGCRDFLIGIGGSATTEAGIGMLSALGFSFLDVDGNPVKPIIDEMDRMVRIDDTKVDKELMQCHFEIACDVKNPLLGNNGAVYVYGPQKGVALEEREVLDQKLFHFAKVVEQYVKTDKKDDPGAGAAGGIGFTFLSFFPNVTMKSGADLVIEKLGVETEIVDADVVITGEGRIDAQTAMGKGPIQLAKLAKKYACKVYAFAGCIGDGADACLDAMDNYCAITPFDMPLEDAMKSSIATENMSKAVETFFSRIECDSYI